MGCLEPAAELGMWSVWVAPRTVYGFLGRLSSLMFGPAVSDEVNSNRALNVTDLQMYRT